jgi:hypothetical protein
MSDVSSKIGQAIYSSRVQVTEPSDKIFVDPCGPELTKTDSAELTVLFPKTSDGNKKTIPLMGGSIIKIGLGSKEIDFSDNRYTRYVRNIRDNVNLIFNDEQLATLHQKSTSAIRVTFNKLLVESLSSNSNIGIIPLLYLSSTTESLENIDEKTDYFGIIRKNASFSFLPIESIRDYLEKIALFMLDEDPSIINMDQWTGLSGKTYGELYDISIKKSPTDDEIESLILDCIPFLNLSADEIINEPIKPVSGGYFTIIGNAIYLKMPDISGTDSAGFGDDYITDSGLNFLFQLISSDSVNNVYSVKNIELKKTIPVYANLIEPSPSDYDLRVPEEFLISFTANKKPSSVYLSPVIPENVSIKNDFFKSIKASQSGSFIEYNPYPNPFVSIFDEKIILNKSGKSPSQITVKNVDYPFSKVQLYGGNNQNNYRDSGLGKIKYVINNKYNNGKYSYGPTPILRIGEEEISGPVNNYISQILGKLPELESDSNIIDNFKVGFPFVEEFFQKSSSVIGQTLSTYEFTGSLSRENLILHSGKSFDDKDPESSGKIGNNKRYFNKKFISNSIGLCQGYRPRVFSKPEAFIPSTWIKATTVSVGEDDSFSASFSPSDLLKFYTKYTTGMKFVVYVFDGENQLSKIENGYLNIQEKAPEITVITPNGSAADGIILACDGSGFTGSSRITIETSDAKYIDIIKINNLKIEKNSSWIITENTISINIPCNSGIPEGFATIAIARGDLYSGESQIYIANALNTTDETQEVSELPGSVPDLGPLSADEVSSSNLAISGETYEIPISYKEYRSRIIIKSKKGIFKQGRSIYLYLGFDTEENAKKFSQEVVKIDKDKKAIYAAKNFQYELENSITGDFYRKSNKKAYLYFPGKFSNLPLSILTTDLKKAYFIISSNQPSDFSPDANLGILELGKDAEGTTPSRPPFIEPPLVVGLSADFVGAKYPSVSHLGNFTNEYTTISKLIKEKEGLASYEGTDVIDVKDKFEKLIVLFKYRDIKKFKRRKFSLYIKNKKVSNLFLMEGVKRATDLFEKEVPFYAKYFYYFVIKNLNISTNENPEVRVDIYDPDFAVNTTSQNKYIDYSFRVKKDEISLATDDSGSIFISKDILQTYLDNSKYGFLFGNYSTDRAETGFFLNKYKDNILFDFDSFPGVSINSSITGTVSDIPEVNNTKNKVTLLKDVDSEIVSVLPNAYFNIPGGSELYFDQYLEGDQDYLVFLRFSVLDICKLAVMKPEIVSIYPEKILVPGNIITLKVKNILNNFTIEIAGTQAKIIDVRSTETDIYEVDAVVPEGIAQIITIDICGLKLYNGDQILGNGDNQLGKQLAQAMNRAASGFLSKTAEQFEKYKEKLLKNPLKFIGKTIDWVHQAKEFLTSFCNFSFKITADLSLRLDGFSQLLIPVKVIFCIIDVICNLFNPFQLPLAIIRLFECLYDLVLLLPQISIPVMFLSLLIHLLDFLECLIVRILDFITIINLIIDAIVLAISGNVNFREIIMLEELLLKHVISLEADLDMMEPIIQILSLFLQLLSITFKFPCTINPNSLSAPCGIDGFELGAMISGLIGEASGAAPHIKYLFDKQYLIPVGQPYVDRLSESGYSPPSYDYAIQPDRGGIAFDGSSATNRNVYEISNFNSKSLRKKNSSYSSTDDIDDITTDSPISLKANYTKRKKNLSSQQSVQFIFKGRTWKSAFSAFDRQIIDEYQNFDVPVSLLSRDGENLRLASASSYGNLYSMIDGKEMLSVTPAEGTASVRPLILDIVQNGVTVTRTFDTIPCMVVMDDDSNIYIIDEGGIIFDTYNEVGGSETEVIGIKEIRATIINQKSSSTDSFDTEEEPYNEDGDTQKIFSLPQLYLIDTRVAAEAIQSKCETASINQLPLDLSEDGGATEVEKMLTCIGDFLNSIKTQTAGIKGAVSVGSVPSKMSTEQVESAYLKLIDCTNDSIDNICSIVVNPLNTSFKLVGDSDLTPILPDPVSSAEEASGFDGASPPLTGAREYAGGIGDAITVEVGLSAVIELIPRDSYDNIIYYDLSQKSRLQIISDTTENAMINFIPLESNPQNYWNYDSGVGSYIASIKSSNPGVVKIRVTICGSTVQALTYSDLVVPSEDGDKVNCIPSAEDLSVQQNAVPLGALTRIDRILTITFVSTESEVITSSDSGDSTIITDPQLFSTNMEN